MLRIGLTGGIGSGKSTACGIFAHLGAPCYDSDLEAKRIMNQDADVRRAIVQEFGELSYIDGKLNRKFLAQQVFCNHERLETLNKITHGAVIQDFTRWAKECEEQGAKYVIMESAILFDSNLGSLFDKTVTISAPECERVRRSVVRDSSTQSEVEKRLYAQMTDAQREELADYTIYNIDRDLLVEQVERLHKIFSEA